MDNQETQALGHKRWNKDTQNKKHNTENLKDEEHRPEKKPKGESRCDEE
jgi:hypothetical protein